MRFKVGDRARYVIPGTAWSAKFIGEEVTITALRPVDTSTGMVADYLLDIHDAHPSNPYIQAWLACFDYQLRRIDDDWLDFKEETEEELNEVEA